MGRQDTINYDVSRFISPKDESVKDILKRLPGIQVNDAGKISYNGKDISRFYVEGMDLSDGRYGQISNNLQANAVETAQVLENHQPIRVLSKKISTEDIAPQPKAETTIPEPLAHQSGRRNRRLPHPLVRQPECNAVKP